MLCIISENCNSDTNCAQKSKASRHHFHRYEFDRYESVWRSLSICIWNTCIFWCSPCVCVCVFVTNECVESEHKCAIIFSIIQPHEANEMAQYSASDWVRVFGDIGRSRPNQSYGVFVTCTITITYNRTHTHTYHNNTSLQPSECEPPKNQPEVKVAHWHLYLLQHTVFVCTLRLKTNHTSSHTPPSSSSTSQSPCVCVTACPACRRKSFAVLVFVHSCAVLLSIDLPRARENQMNARSATNLWPNAHARSAGRA